MDINYINPFVNALTLMMETMLEITPELQPPYQKTEKLTHGDVSGIIGFGGKGISGSVVISFPTDTALTIYEAMMGESVSCINMDVQDTIGEIANMVAGGAKKEFADAGMSFHISIPTVVVGKEHSLGHKTEIPAVVVPFEIENNKSFTMEISLKINKKDPFATKIEPKTPEKASQEIL